MMCVFHLVQFGLLWCYCYSYCLCHKCWQILLQVATAGSAGVDDGDGVSDHHHHHHHHQQHNDGNKNLNRNYSKTLTVNCFGVHVCAANLN